ncbi:hypothetical protein RHSP_41370 (plasmid) [Rhizobium freirei PRF 81]|uniref:Uncharacterized protein n=1 Tax=Rhizobium freirei PRF 81 TaxID=363754 RepID=N6UY81_9HYPH|nr:hypothetical protein [Rhizobium freirei]ENN83832.1 hypothetical protein RHSP_41370 [Rhizobium freirei PRF 81]
MLEVLATLTLEVPYDGLSGIAGMGFALDQFARAQGFHSFAEWAAVQFQKGRSITASVAKSDDLDTSINPVPDRASAGFGYEVTVWVAASDDD